MDTHYSDSKSFRISLVRHPYKKSPSGMISCARVVHDMKMMMYKVVSDLGVSKLSYGPTIRTAQKIFSS
jgi:hypothetical protein